MNEKAKYLYSVGNCMYQLTIRLHPFYKIFLPTYSSCLYRYIFSLESTYKITHAGKRKKIVKIKKTKTIYNLNSSANQEGNEATILKAKWWLPSSFCMVTETNKRENLTKIQLHFPGICVKGLTALLRSLDLQ